MKHLLLVLRDAEKSCVSDEGAPAEVKVHQLTAGVQAQLLHRGVIDTAALSCV